MKGIALRQQGAFRLLASLGFCLALLMAPARAQTEENDIASLTHQIIRAEIEFERYCVRYRIASSEEPKFRRSRYFVAQQGQAGLLLASSCITLKEVSRFGKKKGPREFANKNANVLGLLGCIVGGASSAVELAANGVQYLQHKNQSVDPRVARVWVARKLHEIDALLALREAALKQYPQETTAVQIAACEGRLLKYYRDLGLYEFADWYADDRSYQPSNSVFYALNTASNTLSALSYGFAIHALTDVRASLPQNCLALVGDGVALPTAPLVALVENLMYKRAYRKLAKQINEPIYNAEPQARLELRKLNEFAAKADPASLEFSGAIKKRIAIYNLWNDKFDVYVDEKTSYLRHLHEVASESVLAGPAIGGVSIAEDVVSTSSYVQGRFRKRPKTSNDQSKAAAICLAASAGAGLVYNGQSLVRELLYERKLRKKNELPEQQLQIRLDTLVSVEKDLKD